MPGYADLPLHRGHVPRRVYAAMKRLAKAISMYIVEVHGPEALVRGLADPVWFQAFNNVIGMDWDSSGSTTVLTAVLKEVASEEELGFKILGGKGSSMRAVPQEAERVADAYGLDAERITAFSRLAARVDSSMVQDGYDLYHHAVAVAETGFMVVVQQGMNTSRGLARRYHIDKATVEEPHSGVSGAPAAVTLNAASRLSRGARRVYLEIVSEGPRRFERLLWEAYRALRGQRSLLDYVAGGAGGGRAARRPYLYKPVRPSRRLLRSVEEVYKFNPSSELELALAPGLGPVLVRALALIADLVYSTPTDTSDPLTHPLDPSLYAYAVGGKDGVPRRFDFKTAMLAANLIEEAVRNARLGERERERALYRLHRALRRMLEGGGPGGGGDTPR